MEPHVGIDTIGRWRKQYQSSSYTRERSIKAATCRPGIRPSPETKSTGDFAASGTGRMVHLLCKLPGLWWCYTAAQSDQHTCPPSLVAAADYTRTPVNPVLQTTASLWTAVVLDADGQLPMLCKCGRDYSCKDPLFSGLHRGIHKSLLLTCTETFF